MLSWTGSYKVYNTKKYCLYLLDHHFSEWHKLKLCQQQNKTIGADGNAFADPHKKNQKVHPHHLARKYFLNESQIDWMKPNEFGFAHTNPNWVSCLQFVLRFDKDLGCACPCWHDAIKTHKTV